MLGIILCLEILRGKEATKTKEFNASFGATAGCTMCLAQLVAPVREGEERPSAEGDAWFDSVTHIANLHSIIIIVCCKSKIRVLSFQRHILEQL